MKRVLLILLFSALFGRTPAQELRSPDRRLHLRFELTPAGEATYRLDLEGQPVLLPGRLGFRIATLPDRPQTPDETLTRDFTIAAVRYDSLDERWQPVWGEERTIRNHYNELAVTLSHTSGRRMTVRFRLFDDGLGFRYEFADQPRLQYFIVRDELTEFALTGDHTAYWIPCDYDTQEFDYTVSRLSEIPGLFDRAVGGKRIVQRERNRVQTALLMKSDEGLYILLHEAALVGYSCMHLEAVGGNRLRTHLTPDAIGNKAYMQTPCHTPWRTVTVSRDARDLLRSRLTLNLNEPCAIEDTSWIRPLKYMGVWWEMITGKSTWSYTSDFASVRLGQTNYRTAAPHGRHGATTDNCLRYIDFAAAHGFDALLIEGWNAGWEDWENRWKERVFDFVTPYPDFDLEAVTAHAREKGLELIMHHETSASVRNYERLLDTAYRFMTAHGYRTVKSGYVGRILPRGEYHYGQWMVDHYLHAVRTAARYRIAVNAHEAVRPTGLCRTWPNLLANESARGSEYHAFGGIRTHHTAILPFTRLAGGAMDYTPGIFEMEMAQHNPRNRSHAYCTIANQLALYVTMPSPVQMACDLPETYERFPDAFRFIEQVAVAWDRSVYIEAEPAKYITVARRAKDSDIWYVGSIAGDEAHEAVIPLDFLDPDRPYTATVYGDAPDADCRTNPQSYRIRTLEVDASTVLHQRCVEAGGCAIRIAPR